MRVRLLLMLGVVGCGAPVEREVDAGTLFDAGVVDAGVGVDAGEVDAGKADAGLDAVDAGEVDAGEADAGHRDAGTVDAGSLDASVDAGHFERLVVDSGVLLLNGQAWPYELLKLTLPGKRPTYAQYFPPVNDGGPAPTIVTAMPYNGIRWTGEEVDTRWANKAPVYGVYPDTDGPFDAGTDTIVYEPTSLENSLSQCFIYLYHGLGVLQVYGRFYAGGDLDNEVDDLNAGFRFLEGEARVNPQAIGVFGGSWGGFEAVYGAMHAPAQVRPITGAVLYPLTDFEAQVHYLDVEVPARYADPQVRATFASFFGAYRRRMATSVSGGFSGWNAAAVQRTLKTPLLVFHDTWDTLVPVAETRALTDAGLNLTAYELEHPGQPTWVTPPLDHFTVDKDAQNSAVTTFAVAHLLKTLGVKGPLLVPVSIGFMHVFLQLQRQHQLTDAVTMQRSLVGLAERLSSLCEARVTMFDGSTNTALSGPAWLAWELNTLWKTSLDESTVCAQLRTGLPP